jgi:hypothetical protein
MMKRLFNMLVLVALINLFALIGFVGYLFVSGKLNEKRINQMAMVLRGEYDEEESPTMRPAAKADAPIRSAEEIALAKERERYNELMGERRIREIEDRRRLGEDTRMEVDRLLREVTEQERRVREQLEAVREEKKLAGFEKQLEYFSKMDPKRAKHLMMKEMKEADVVQLLMSMDESRVPKIIDKCKTDEELNWIGRILTQIGQMQELATGVDGSIAPAS